MGQQWMMSQAIPRHIASPKPTRPQGYLNILSIASAPVVITGRNS